LKACPRNRDVGSNCTIRVAALPHAAFDPRASVLRAGRARPQVKIRSLLLRELLHNLAGLGESAFLQLREDEFAVFSNLEGSAGRADKFGLHPRCLLDFGRQTGGLGRVVSHHTILNADLHENLRAQDRPPRRRGAARVPSISSRAPRSEFSAPIRPNRRPRLRTGAGSRYTSQTRSARPDAAPRRSKETP
jgi:hypothetical protein